MSMRKAVVIIVVVSMVWGGIAVAIGATYVGAIVGGLLVGGTTGAMLGRAQIRE